MIAEDIQQQKLLVAISGGIDSVVLAHWLHSKGVEMVLAHCNFQLRGEESDGDEAFVRTFASSIGVPLEVIRFDTKAYAHTHHLNTQLAARQLRYEWFYKLLAQHHCDKIAIAHNANDNVETFFINLSRGTGLQGLLGIPAETAAIIRPLLKVTRNEIVQYAHEHSLSWREDSSNATDHYIRNRIRHHITPQLAQIHPNFLENFRQTQAYLRQSADFIDFYVQKIKEGSFLGENPIRIDTKKLLEAVPVLDFVLHQLFYPYGFGNIPDLKQLLLKAAAGKQLFSATHSLVKDNDCLWLTVLNTSATPPTLSTEILFPPFAIEKNNTAVAYIDADKVTEPLRLRQKQEGDVFYPLGLGKKKKLSKFFTDEKYTQAARQQQWLLCSGDAIVWVVGRRLDHRFRVSAQTQRVLKIEMIEKNKD